jgi:hypothetical protein
MKKVLFGLFALLLVSGAGCSEALSLRTGGEVAGITTEPPRVGPYPSSLEADPAREVQTAWAQLAYAADAQDCADFKAHFSLAQRAILTEDDCTRGFAAFKPYLSIDWNAPVVSEDRLSVALNDEAGKPFITYVYEDGAWYLDTKFWGE